MKSKFELEHIGINTPNAEEAEKLANLLSLVFNLEPRHGQKSEFAGPYFECMKAPFLGTNGHIAMRTPNLAAAMEDGSHPTRYWVAVKRAGKPVEIDRERLKLHSDM